MQGRLDETQHALTRLIGRYGRERGHYLFGELCLLRALGLDAFQARHTERQLAAIAEALRPLDLWPGLAPVNDADEDRLALVAASLVEPPLLLKVGADLFWGITDLAEVGPGSVLDDTAWFAAAAAAVSETLGFALPRLQVALDLDQPPLGYRLFVAGAVAEEGLAYPHQDLVVGPEDEPPPAMPYAWTPDPAGPGWVAWMPVGPEAMPPADLPRLHWLGAIARHLSARLPRHASRLMTSVRVHELLQLAEGSGYDHELERYVSVPELRLVFQALLAQGVPLRPIGTIMEGLTRGVLADFAGRKLAMEELERIQRQLPVVSTARLVAMARQALGLAAEPPPGFAMPPPPSPVRAEAPLPDGEARARWAALLALQAHSGVAAMFWVSVLRTQASSDDRETGRFLKHWLKVAPGGPEVPLEAVRARLGAEGLAPVLAMLGRYGALERPLGRIRRWLDDPRQDLSAEALAMLAAPRWESWRFGLAEPARLAVRLGLADELAAFEVALRG